MVSMPHAVSESAPSPATYRMVVRSAEEAVKTIQSQWGGQAKVLSVRQVPGQGLAGLFGRPRLEVIAQVGDERALPVESSKWEEALSRRGGLAGETASHFGDRDAETTEAGPAGEERIDEQPKPSDDSVSLTEILRRAGFSEPLRARLQVASEWQAVRRAPLHRQVAAVGTALRGMAEAGRSRSVTERVAFVGTAGSGRTTALAKWIAARAGAGEAVDRVVQWSAGRTVPDVLRQAAVAAGVSVETLAFGSDLAPSQSVGRTLAVDCTALSLNDPEEREAQRRALDRARISTRVLVLNALYDVGSLQRIAGVGRELGATHVVFTHLDELREWGRLWELLVEGELCPLFLSSGPAHDHGWERDVVAAVLQRTVPGMGRTGR